MFYIVPLVLCIVYSVCVNSSPLYTQVRHLFHGSGSPLLLLDEVVVRTHLDHCCCGACDTSSVEVCL